MVPSRCAQPASLLRTSPGSDHHSVDEALNEGSREQQESGAAPSSARGARRAALIGLSALVLIAVGATAAWLLKPPSFTTPQTTRFIVALPQTFPSLARPAVAISPDGRRLQPRRKVSSFRPTASGLVITQRVSC